jgi:hypothetical protein
MLRTAALSVIFLSHIWRSLETFNGGVMNKKCVVILFLIAVLPSFGYANQNLEPYQLFGSWKLISWIITSPSGEVTYPMGESPEGRIIYTGNGQMSAQLMHPNAILPNFSALSKKEVMGYMHKMFISYYGTYSVNASEKTVSHHVLGSNMPSIIGGDLLREYEFSDSNHIRLIARMEGTTEVENAGITGTNVLVWGRIH